MSEVTASEKAPGKHRSKAKSPRPKSPALTRVKVSGIVTLKGEVAYAALWVRVDDQLMDLTNRSVDNLQSGTYTLHWEFRAEVGASIAWEVLVNGKSTLSSGPHVMPDGAILLNDTGHAPKGYQPLEIIVP